jgi:hypothetical protein
VKEEGLELLASNKVEEMHRRVEDQYKLRCGNIRVKA